MTAAYIIITLALLLWKAYYAWLRGTTAYTADRRDHHSLYEYLIGNGATSRQALQPFATHAMERAFQPLLKQWRLLAALGVLALFAGAVADGLTVWQALALLAAMIAATGLATLAAISIYILYKK